MAKTRDQERPKHQSSPSRWLDQYLIRFPDGMRAFLKHQAAQNRRSMNAEIVHRLQIQVSAAEALEAVGPSLDNAPPPVDDLDDTPPLKHAPLETRLALVGEARRLFGKEHAQRVWGFVGLPDPPATGPLSGDDPPDTDLVKHVRAFAAQCVVEEPEAVTKTIDLFNHYRDWTNGEAHSSITATVFGKAFAKLGFRRSKRGTTIYLDIRLKSAPSRSERLL